MSEWSPDTLDPENWDEFRAQGHRMLDDILDYLENIRKGPVWKPIPAQVRDSFREPLPEAETELADVHAAFMHSILPFVAGNTHPGFFGWVHGAGTPVGLLAEMLAAGLNANLGGRDQIPIEVERQVMRWACGLFGFPDSASGLLVTGTSMANLLAVLVARTARLGLDVRQQGVTANGSKLVAYASEAAHDCIGQALDISGFGRGALRTIPVGPDYRMNVDALKSVTEADRRLGLTPFLLVGTAGSVDVGAIDELDALATIARDTGLWFHVDGAYGALAMLAPELASRLNGIEKADSIAFDFHKWGQVPYDAGCLLVKDGRLHYDTFASPAAYLKRELRGLAAGSPWPCDFGPDLSRGFRALKVWFTLKTYGKAKLGNMIAGTCELARYLAQQIDASPELERLAPVSLNIVCFRYCCTEPDKVNAQIVVALHESGISAPSTTTLQGKLAIRAAIVNHRTRPSDIDALLKAVISFGRSLASTPLQKRHE
ncbi:MAG: pyridoxal-dependent decarboxylase [Proteobacteria bacterium]|nr:pyridoxal-dependent decarboxylase [Pseudomonadota bacterium]